MHRNSDAPGASTRAPTGSPIWLPVVPDAIPRELTGAVAWYPAIIKPKAGKPGQWDKIPGNPTTGKPATWSDASTRCTFDAAFMAYQSGRFGGVGYMMDAKAGLIGIDLDHCVSPDDVIAPWALEIAHQLEGAYWERSISGTGLRGFCRASLPDGVGGARSKIEGCSVELYTDVRFLVVTGQALKPVDELPDLQSAVDALHARLTAGRVRATGTAVASGLTGPNTNPSPDVFAIIEAMMSDRHGASMMDRWARDQLHVAGASEDDWALETEIAYQAVRRGFSGEELHRITEETMRAGPYRAKWDEPRGRVTWLAQDVANSCETVLKRLGDRPLTQVRREDVLDDQSIPSDVPPADETPDQKIARLERLLEVEREGRAQNRAVQAVQQAVIQAQRTELEDKTAYISLVTEVLAKPNEEMSSTEKVVFLVLTWETHYRADRGRSKLPLIALAERSGVSKNTVSMVSRAICERPGSPFERRVIRELKRGQDGSEQWVSTIEIRPRTERAEDTMRAGITLPKVPDKPRHGGSPQAAVARWRPFAPCNDHQGANVILRGLCTVCGDVIGETLVSADECRALNHQLGDSDREGSPVVVPVLSSNQVGDSGSRTLPLIDFETATQDRAPKPPGCQTDPPAWLGEWPDPDQEEQTQPLPRCVRSGCTDLCGPGDGLLCVGHRAEASTSAVAGGSE